MEITRKEIVELWLKKSTEKEVLMFLISQTPELVEMEAQKKLKFERMRFENYFKQSNYMRDRLMQRYENWLKATITFPIKRIHGPGRKEFAKSSQRTKLNRLSEIRNKYSVEELGLAASANARARGHRLAAQCLESIAKHPEVVASSSVQSKSAALLNSAEAVGLICRSDLTKAQYEDLRSTSLSKGVNMYPPYYEVIKAKELCYPSGKRFCY